MTLYHASNVEVRTPRIIRSTRMLDSTAPSLCEKAYTFVSRLLMRGELAPGANRSLTRDALPSRR